MVSASQRKMRVALVPWMVAGIRTQYENLHAVTLPTDVHVDVWPVFPYKAGGLIERLPLDRRVKGRLRTTEQTLPLLVQPSYDAIWTQVWLPLLPFLAAAELGLKPRPAIIYATDNTPRLLDSFSSHYGTPLSAGSRHLRDSAYRHAMRRFAAIVPWSQWAARSFVRDYGAPASRLHVIPPGVDIDAWSAPAHRQAGAAFAGTPAGLFKLLFVGADFARKGGPLLVELFRQNLREACELHIVTRDDVAEAPGLHVYRSFGPNDAGLRRLYQECDALVLPTRADCFSLVSIEAMACGLPVVSCAVGGIPEIVQHGTTGFLVPPDEGIALRQAIEALVRDRPRAIAMGRAGRRLVEERFDNRHTAAALFDLLRQLGQGTHDGGRSPARAGA
jgi:glycosyltransferase involved in cell wall biosynthesis